tara:strand:+ start:6632 stop:7027 length:396 start_codon:yes stop_codon:yes gene_type:complete
MMTLTGDKELEKVLKRLPNNVQRNLAKRSMRKAVALFRKESRKLLPFTKRKQLKKAIKTRVSLRPDGTLIGRVFTLSGGTKGAPHAHMVEWGSENNKPTFFMTRTFEANKERVVDLFRDQIRLEIAKEAAK